MKIWKWAARVAAVVAASALVVVAYIYFASERLLDRKYPLPPSSLHASSGAAAVARGNRLAHAFGCTDCHRPNLEGAFIPDFGVWSLNLTRLARHRGTERCRTKQIETPSGVRRVRRCY